MQLMQKCNESTVISSACFANAVEVQSVVKITPIYADPRGRTTMVRLFKQKVLLNRALDLETFNATVASYLGALSTKAVGAKDFKIELRCIEDGADYTVCSTRINDFRRDFSLSSKSVGMDSVSRELYETFSDMLEVHLSDRETQTCTSQGFFENEYLD